MATDHLMRDAIVSANKDAAPLRRALLVGGLTVGALDLLDALIFFGLRGARLIRIPQSIAAGLIGRAAFDGGVATAVLGVVLHFTIAYTIVAVYFVMSRLAPVLTRRPFVCGAVYGLVVWAAMNLFVVPFSANGAHAIPWPIAVNAVVVNAWLIHILGVGIPSALAARSAFPPRP